MARLTPKQAVFVAEYCLDFNGARAAIEAGYSKTNARFQAAENLAKPNVQAAIQERLRPRVKRLNLTLDNTLNEYRLLAFARLGASFTDADGELLPVDEWPADLAPLAMQASTDSPSRPRTGSRWTT